MECENVHTYNMFNHRMRDLLFHSFHFLVFWLPVFENLYGLIYLSIVRCAWKKETINRKEIKPFNFFDDQNRILVDFKVHCWKFCIQKLEKTTKSTHITSVCILDLFYTHWVYNQSIFGVFYCLVLWNDLIVNKNKQIFTKGQVNIIQWSSLCLQQRIVLI